MLKKKAMNRIFFTTIIFFVVFALYNLKIINDRDVDTVNYEINKNKEELYTINKDGFVSKTAVYVGKVYTLEDKIKAKLEIMVKENNKNSLLPSYFKPILPENTKVLDVVVEDSLVKVYFSKELENITEEQSEKMIEAIVYTITDENILGIEIYVEGQMLKYVPHTKKQLPTVLTKDFGINKTYNIFNYSNIVKVVMTYYTECNDEYYKVPVTKYVNDNREKLEIIMDDLSSINRNKNLINLLDNFTINGYKIGQNSIKIDINKELDINERDLVFSSLFNNYDVNKIIILVNGEKKYEKTKKNIEK